MLSVKIKVTNIIIMMDLLQHNEPITCNMAPYKDLFISLWALCHYQLRSATCRSRRSNKQHTGSSTFGIYYLLSVPGAPVVIRERGCAKQVYSYQDLERGQWRTVTTVMEETYTRSLLRASLILCWSYNVWRKHLLVPSPYSPTWKRRYACLQRSFPPISYADIRQAISRKGDNLFKIEEAYVITAGVWRTRSGRSSWPPTRSGATAGSRAATGTPACPSTPTTSTTTWTAAASRSAPHMEHKYLQVKRSQS